MFCKMCERGGSLGEKAGPDPVGPEGPCALRLEGGGLFYWGFGFLYVGICMFLFTTKSSGF